MKKSFGRLKKRIKEISYIQFYLFGKNYFNSPYILKGYEKTNLEVSKSSIISRTDVLNFLLQKLNRKTTYLEIGVRNPLDNFAYINADIKFSVDPGIEYKENPVDFKITSDAFYEKLNANEILTSDIKFDVIFIDGLHLAEQVDRDITNSLKYLKEDGFIVLHDCNPPTEWHAREDFYYHYSPAYSCWNGTTWKAFLKWRFEESIYSCCIDSDWGIGILSKANKIGNSIKKTNSFFEYNELDKNRKELLNLISFDEFKKLL